MKNYVTEFVGTFFFILTIGFVVLHGSDLAPIAIGSVLMVMVYMGGHISGAHYNPAVTLALMMRGNTSVKEGVNYIISQLAGAFVASLVVYLVMDKSFFPAPAANLAVWKPLLVEILFTFALVLVVLNVATTAATKGNSFYGLAIGFTVTVGAFSVGSISGGAFNPAIGTGPIVMDTLVGGTSISHLWLYIVGPAIGAILAAVAFGIQHPQRG